MRIAAGKSPDAVLSDRDVGRACAMNASKTRWTALFDVNSVSLILC